jgi:opacity protein-like surface antigen
MLNPSRLSTVRTVLFCLLAALAASTGKAQAQAQTESSLDRVLSRFDLGINGTGHFTKDVSGTNYLGVTVDQRSSNTFGALVELRYTKSPWIGAQLNYSYARFTQNFSQYIIGGAQNNASEYSIGYVAHPPHQIYGLQPFFGVGGGATVFHPTAGGGQGLPQQGAATVYYALGVERSVISPHFGLRVQVRQTFFLAPDFYQNYLYTGQRSWTFQPGAGFYLRY